SSASPGTRPSRPAACSSATRSASPWRSPPSPRPDAPPASPRSPREPDSSPRNPALGGTGREGGADADVPLRREPDFSSEESGCRRWAGGGIRLSALGVGVGVGAASGGLAVEGLPDADRVEVPEALDGAVDLDDGHVLPVAGLQLRVGVDVDLPPPGACTVALLGDDAARLVAQVAAGAGVEDHSGLGHAPILRAAP